MFDDKELIMLINEGMISCTDIFQIQISDIIASYRQVINWSQLNVINLLSIHHKRFLISILLLLKRNQTDECYFNEVSDIFKNVSFTFGECDFDR